MSQRWAEECAAYERGGAAEYLKAALEYERRRDAGWSGQTIADEVSGAGFQIHRATVNRRLAALSVARATRLRANSKGFLEAFAAAYEDVNAQGRGGGGSAQSSEVDLNEAWQHLLGTLNAYFLEGARLENQTDEGTELDAYAQASRMFYLRLIDKQIEAEAAQLDSEWKRLAESEF